MNGAAARAARSALGGCSAGLSAQEGEEWPEITHFERARVAPTSSGSMSATGRLCSMPRPCEP
jgi:hypothetical protein